MRTTEMASWLASLGEPAARLDDARALTLDEGGDLDALMKAARARRDASRGNVVTYSRKVFIPLTHLCRDVCHYCTFAQTPRRIPKPYMTLDEVLELCRQGAR